MWTYITSGVWNSIHLPHERFGELSEQPSVKLGKSLWQGRERRFQQNFSQCSVAVPSLSGSMRRFWKTTIIIWIRCKSAIMDDIFLTIISKNPHSNVTHTSKKPCSEKSRFFWECTVPNKVASGCIWIPNGSVKKKKKKICLIKCNLIWMLSSNPNVLKCSA